MNYLENLTDIGLKRVYKFAIKRSIGEYLEDEVILDQLFINQRDGLVQVRDLALDVQKINSKFLSTAPIKLRLAIINSLEAKISYSAIFSDGFRFQINGIHFEIEPQPQNEAKTQDTIKETRDSTPIPPSNSSPEEFQVNEGIQFLAHWVDVLVSSLEASIENISLKFIVPNSSLSVSFFTRKLTFQNSLPSQSFGSLSSTDISSRLIASTTRPINKQHPLSSTHASISARDILGNAKSLVLEDIQISLSDPSLPAPHSYPLLSFASLSLKLRDHHRGQGQGGGGGGRGGRAHSQTIDWDLDLNLPSLSFRIPIPLIPSLITLVHSFLPSSPAAPLPPCSLSLDEESFRETLPPPHSHYDSQNLSHSSSLPLPSVQRQEQGQGVRAALEGLMRVDPQLGTLLWLKRHYQEKKTRSQSTQVNEEEREVEGGVRFEDVVELMLQHLDERQANFLSPSPFSLGLGLGSAMGTQAQASPWGEVLGEDPDFPSSDEEDEQEHGESKLVGRRGMSFGAVSDLYFDPASSPGQSAFSHPPSHSSPLPSTTPRGTNQQNPQESETGEETGEETSGSRLSLRVSIQSLSLSLFLLSPSSPSTNVESQLLLSFCDIFSSLLFIASPPHTLSRPPLPSRSPYLSSSLSIGSMDLKEMRRERSISIASNPSLTPHTTTTPTSQIPTLPFSRFGVEFLPSSSLDEKGVDAVQGKGFSPERPTWAEERDVEGEVWLSGTGNAEQSLMGKFEPKTRHSILSPHLLISLSLTQSNSPSSNASYPSLSALSLKASLSSTLLSLRPSRLSLWVSSLASLSSLLPTSSEPSSFSSMSVSLSVTALDLLILPSPSRPALPWSQLLDWLDWEGRSNEDLEETNNLELKRKREGRRMRNAQTRKRRWKLMEGLDCEGSEGSPSLSTLHPFLPHPHLSSPMTSSNLTRHLVQHPLPLSLPQSSSPSNTLPSTPSSSSLLPPSSILCRHLSSVVGGLRIQFTSLSLRFSSPPSTSSSSSYPSFSSMSSSFLSGPQSSQPSSGEREGVWVGSLRVSAFLSSSLPPLLSHYCSLLDSYSSLPYTYLSSSSSASLPTSSCYWETPLMSVMGRDQSDPDSDQPSALLLPGISITRNVPTSSQPLPSSLSSSIFLPNSFSFSKDQEEDEEREGGVLYGDEGGLSPPPVPLSSFMMVRAFRVVVDLRKREINTANAILDLVIPTPEDLTPLTPSPSSDDPRDSSPSPLPSNLSLSGLFIEESEPKPSPHEQHAEETPQELPAPTTEESEDWGAGSVDLDKSQAMEFFSFYPSEHYQIPSSFSSDSSTPSSSPANNNPSSPSGALGGLGLVLISEEACLSFAEDSEEEEEEEDEEKFQQEDQPQSQSQPRVSSRGGISICAVDTVIEMRTSPHPLPPHPHRSFLSLGAGDVAVFELSNQQRQEEVLRKDWFERWGEEKNKTMRSDVQGRGARIGKLTHLLPFLHRTSLHAPSGEWHLPLPLNQDMDSGVNTDSFDPKGSTPDSHGWLSANHVYRLQMLLEDDPQPLSLDENGSLGEGVGAVKRASFHMSLQDVTLRYDPSSLWISRTVSVLTPAAPASLLQKKREKEAQSQIQREKNDLVRRWRRGEMGAEEVKQTLISLSTLPTHPSTPSLSNHPSSPPPPLPALPFEVVNIGVRVRKCLIDFCCPSCPVPSNPISPSSSPLSHGSRVLVSVGYLSLSSSLFSSSDRAGVNLNIRDLSLHLSPTLRSVPQLEQPTLPVLFLLDSPSNLLPDYYQFYRQHYNFSSSQQHQPTSPLPHSPPPSRSLLDMDTFLDAHSFLPLLSLDHLQCRLETPTSSPSPPSPPSLITQSMSTLPSPPPIPPPLTLSLSLGLCSVSSRLDSLSVFSSTLLEWWKDFEKAMGQGENSEDSKQARSEEAVRVLQREIFLLTDAEDEEEVSEEADSANDENQTNLLDDYDPPTHRESDVESEEDSDEEDLDSSQGGRLMEPPSLIESYYPLPNPPSPSFPLPAASLPSHPSSNSLYGSSSADFTARWLPVFDEDEDGDPDPLLGFSVEEGVTEEREEDNVHFAVVVLNDKSRSQVSFAQDPHIKDTLEQPSRASSEEELEEGGFSDDDIYLSDHDEDKDKEGHTNRSFGVSFGQKRETHSENHEDEEEDVSADQERQIWDSLAGGGVRAWEVMGGEERRQRKRELRRSLNRGRRSSEAAVKPGSGSLFGLQSLSLWGSNESSLPSPEEFELHSLSQPSPASLPLPPSFTHPNSHPPSSFEPHIDLDELLEGRPPSSPWNPAPPPPPLTNENSLFPGDRFRPIGGVHNAMRVSLRAGEGRHSDSDHPEDIRLGEKAQVGLVQIRGAGLRPSPFEGEESAAPAGGRPELDLEDLEDYVEIERGSVPPLPQLLHPQVQIIDRSREGKKELQGEDGEEQESEGRWTSDPDQVQILPYYIPLPPPVDSFSTNLPSTRAGSNALAEEPDIPPSEALLGLKVRVSLKGSFRLRVFGGWDWSFTPHSAPVLPSDSPIAPPPPTSSSSPSQSQLSHQERPKDHLAVLLEAKETNRTKKDPLFDTAVRNLPKEPRKTRPPPIQVQAKRVHPDERKTQEKTEPSSEKTPSPSPAASNPSSLSFLPPLSTSSSSAPRSRADVLDLRASSLLLSVRVYRPKEDLVPQKSNSRFSSRKNKKKSESLPAQRIWLGVGEVLVAYGRKGGKGRKVFGRWRAHSSHQQMLLPPALSVEMLGYSTPSSSSLEHRVGVSLCPLRLFLDASLLSFLLTLAQRQQILTACLHANPNSHTPITSEESGNDVEILRFQLVRVGSLEVKVDYRAGSLDLAALQRGDPTQALNLLSLDGLELTLKSVSLTDLEGVGMLMESVGRAWTEDVWQHQLTSLISGAGPLRAVSRISSDVSGLLLVPFRVPKGPRKGFTRHPRDEMLRQLRAKAGTLVHTVTRETLHATHRLSHLLSKGLGDLASDASSDRVQDQSTDRPQWSGGGGVRYSQPQGLVDGLGLAYEALSREMGAAAESVVSTPAKEFRRTGSTKTWAKSLLQGLPIAVLKPIAGVAEATSYTLLGLRNLVDPSARIDEEDAWAVED